MVGVFTVGKQNKSKKASWTLRSSILSLLEDCALRGVSLGKISQGREERKGGLFPSLTLSLEENSFQDR